MEQISICCPHCQGKIHLSVIKEGGTTDEITTVDNTEKTTIQPLIKWTDQYNTGIERVDIQHRRLAGLIK